MPTSLHLVFPAYGVAVDVDVVWSTQDTSGRWQCGASASGATGLEWEKLLTATG